MKGTYVLILELLKSSKIEIGARGSIEFEKGYYAYIGSALNNLEARVSRHLRKNKKVFWHIDYLLENATVCDVFFNVSDEKEECELANIFAVKFNSVKHFGSSDCRCDSHLFFSRAHAQLILVIQKRGMKKFEITDLDH